MSLACVLSFHTWSGCLCAKCGKVRDNVHDWRHNCEKCNICGKVRMGAHRWHLLACTNCGMQRDEGDAARAILADVQASWRRGHDKERDWTRQFGYNSNEVHDLFKYQSPSANDELRYRRTLATEISRLGPAAAPLLMRVLRIDHKPSTACAPGISVDCASLELAEVLGTIGDASLAHELLQMLYHGDGAAGAALVALSTKAYPTLAEAFLSSDERLSNCAGNVIASHGPHWVSEVLALFAIAANDSAQQRALRLLKAVNHPPLDESRRALLDDVLTRFGRKGTADLRDLLDSQNEWLKTVAQRALLLVSEIAPRRRGRQRHK